ncbi:hypothetical protein [Bacillus alkalicellulosilyticus]|uniref:hypothetical protein n=1 Tax=Alkalihalobacterium alkalicellulosilyticum TaxID=1912214 RepID=UPI000995E56B|nr:hypothetical protein [Bacillus alkalicellulosilyticus]
MRSILTNEEMIMVENLKEKMLEAISEKEVKYFESKVHNIIDEAIKRGVNHHDRQPMSIS